MADNKYCYPGTNVLRNKLNIKDANELDAAERQITVLVEAELRTEPVRGNLDYMHFRSVHYELFSRLYDWAGKPRVVDIGKGVQFASARFLDENGERIKINVCGIFTNILNEYGFKPDGTLQTCGGMTLYPKDYFCPFDDATGLLHKTENTYSIHWYDKSWMPKSKIIRNKITRIIHRWFGTDIKAKIKKLFFIK